MGAAGFTMKPRRGRLRVGLVVSALILLVDQATKLWIVEAVMDPPRLIPLGPFANLTLVWNRGISFGILGDGAVGPFLLAGLAFAISLGLVMWLRQAESGLLAVGLGGVIGGAVGNAIDRLHWGAVADFVDLHAAGWHWPAFNVADAAITVGVILVLVDGLFPRGNSLK